MARCVTADADVKRAKCGFYRSIPKPLPSLAVVTSGGHQLLDARNVLSRLTLNINSTFSSTASMAGQNAQQPLEADHYQPKDAIGATVKATMITTSAGLFISTIQNTLKKQNVGAMGVFTRTGSTIAVFGRYKDNKESRHGY